MKRVTLILLSFFLLQTRYAQQTGILFADSEIKRFPQAWQLDHGKRLYFGYAQGLGCLAMPGMEGDQRPKIPRLRQSMG